MLKAISSITNAIGALNFKGTWNADTNTPTIVSGVGVKGDYFVVGVAGSTTIDGISNWGVGDWIAYNGNIWQRVEGGADLNGVNLTVSETSLLSGNTGVGGDTTGVVAGITITSKFCVKNDGGNPVAGFVHANNTTASSGAGTFACRSRGTIAAPTAVQSGDNLWTMFLAGNDGTDLALAAQIRVDVDATPGNNDMPGRMVFSTTPDGSQSPVDRMKIDNAGDVTVSTGNLVIGTAGKGIDFSADPSAAGMTSELLDDYEEGTWTPADGSGAGLVFTVDYAVYTKIGRQVSYVAYITYPSTADANAAQIEGFPFTAAPAIFGNVNYTTEPAASLLYLVGTTTKLFLLVPGVNTTNAQMSGEDLFFSGTYFI